VLQKGAIEKFYVNFYMSINIGALIGGLTIPVVVAMNSFAGYMIPVVSEFCH
jgi:POT family proton-dependent oligopeptide transporter